MPEDTQQDSPEPQRRRLRSVVETALWVAAIVAVYLWSQGNIAPAVQAGEEAPDFSLVSTEGRPYRLSDYRGRVIVLNFWATWCGPCRQELPTLSSMHVAMEKDGIIVMAVALDSAADDVRQMAGELKLHMPVLFNDGETGKKFGIRGFPTTFIIGTDGRVSKVFTGYTTEWSLKRAVKAALEARTGKA